MGLALNNPPDIPGLAESRYLGPGREPLSAISKARKYGISRAKYLHWCVRQDVYRDLEVFPIPLYNKAALRPHQQAILNATRRKTPRRNRASPAQRSRREHPAVEAQEQQHDDFKCTPARGELLSVSRRRTPSLERQDAFADAKTAKKCPQRWSSLDDSRLEPEVEELYRLGLLYDDEHLRGSGFGLDAIVHDEPMYTIRSSGRRRRGRNVAFDAASETYEKIGLDLSFAALGDDAALARYLVSSTMSEDQHDEMDVDLTYDAIPSTRITHEMVVVADDHLGYSILPHQRMYGDAPTKNDDTENDDTESDDEDNTPGVSEFPDLISDDDNDYCDNDWAVVRDDGAMDLEEDDVSDLDSVDGGGNAAGGDNPDAWIVLG